MGFRIITIIVFLCANSLQAQFVAGLEYSLAILGSNQERFQYQIVVANENETTDFYEVYNDLGAVSNGIGLRSLGGRFLANKKWIVGYSLGIGYNYFSSSAELRYNNSSTNNRDSIVNAFNGFEFSTQYHSINFSHFIDVHFNPSEKIKITNSVGIGLNALVKTRSKAVEFDGSIINTNHPLLKIQYQPQLTEKYNGFSMTYFASIDLFSIGLFTKPSEFEIPDKRIPFSNLKFNSIGIRFIPDSKLKEEDYRNDY